MEEFTQKPCVVVAGDMLRKEDEIASVLQGLGVGLIRLTQNKTVEGFWREKVRGQQIDFTVYCQAHIPFSEVKCAYQRALCSINLVDSSWQPAGLSVFLEAMACGTPVIATKGLTTEIIGSVAERVEERPFMSIDAGDIEGVRKEVAHFRDDSAARSTAGQRSRDYVEKYFALDIAAESFWRELKNVMDDD